MNKKQMKYNLGLIIIGTFVIFIEGIILGEVKNRFPEFIQWYVFRIDIQYVVFAISLLILAMLFYTINAKLKKQIINKARRF